MVEIPELNFASVWMGLEGPSTSRPGSNERDCWMAGVDPPGQVREHGAITTYISG